MFLVSPPSLCLDFPSLFLRLIIRFQSWFNLFLLPFLVIFLSFSSLSLPLKFSRLSLTCNYIKEERHACMKGCILYLDFYSLSPLSLSSLSLVGCPRKFLSSSFEGKDGFFFLCLSTFSNLAERNVRRGSSYGEGGGFK